MSKLLKNIFKMNFTNAKTGGWPGVAMKAPLKYRESNYTVAELEKRIVADINHR